MPANEQIEVTPLGVCVCGVEFGANAAAGVVVHKAPLCKEFIELEPDEFLTYVRRARGLPDPVSE